MVALASPTMNESFVEPSPYAWLRSRAPVPTTYAPTCEPLYPFQEILENRTSRARSMTGSCTEVVERKFSICIEIWQVELEDGVWRVSFHKYAYVHGDPIQGIDPNGEFAAVVLGIGVSMMMAGPGDYIKGAFESLLTAYAANLAWDVQWALDMTMEDDLGTRLDDDWVLAAIGQGLHDAFNIDTPFGTFNPLDLFDGDSGSSNGVAAMSARPASNGTRPARNAGNVPRVRFGATVNGIFKTMAGAFNAAKDRAGIPTSQVPTRQWTVRGQHSEFPGGAGVRDSNSRNHGRVYEFEVAGPNGKREYKYMVVHDQDTEHGGSGHVHFARSKNNKQKDVGEDYAFSERLNPGERYENMDKTLGRPHVSFASRRGKR